MWFASSFWLFLATNFTYLHDQVIEFTHVFVMGDPLSKMEK